jgi:hypothetical protein
MSNDPLFVLRRLAQRGPTPAGELCEMCRVDIDDAHQHVVDLSSRALLCTCRPCYLLFTAEGAHLRYRAVPERYLSFADFSLGPGDWDQLEIPVGLAFFFHNSSLDRTVAFYPGPAGATESELPMRAWARVTEAHPQLSVAVPDVEAILIRTPDRKPGNGTRSISCQLVPIDACYRLVGQLRSSWRGFDGGSEAREQIDGFFAEVQRRSRPASELGRVGRADEARTG